MKRLYADSPEVREKLPAFRAVAEECSACKQWRVYWWQRPYPSKLASRL